MRDLAAEIAEEFASYDVSESRALVASSIWHHRRKARHALSQAQYEKNITLEVKLARARRRKARPKPTSSPFTVACVRCRREFALINGLNAHWNCKP